MLKIAYQVGMALAMKTAVAPAPVQRMSFTPDTIMGKPMQGQQMSFPPQTIVGRPPAAPKPPAAPNLGGVKGPNFNAAMGAPLPRM